MLDGLIFQRCPVTELLAENYRLNHYIKINAGSSAKGTILIFSKIPGTI
jgi:hypothetical protein